MTTLHEFRGVRYSTPELAEIAGLALGTFHQRLRLGWTVEQAVCLPTRQQINRGVVFNFPPVEGTGAGGVAQEISNISFSDEAQR